MKRVILPFILLILGIGGGIGAGRALVPPAVEEALPDPCGDVPAGAAMEHATDDDSHAAPAADHTDADAHGGTGDAAEYVKLNNQFIVPVVQNAEVAALVILSISVEVPGGQQEAVLQVEPKLRDVFLQVLFDHANTGGFEGMFTASNNMRMLRAALRTAAQDALGDMISDVLIVDIVRQDV